MHACRQKTQQKTSLFEEAKFVKIFEYFESLNNILEFSKNPPLLRIWGLLASKIKPDVDKSNFEVNKLL